MKFKGEHFAIDAPLQNSRGARCPGAPRSAAYDEHKFITFVHYNPKIFERYF